MAEIKLIDETTDFEMIKKIKPYEWDIIVKGRPYYVIRVEEYIHSIGGMHGINDLWAYPRDEEPTSQNIFEYNGVHGAAWGIIYESRNYYRNKWDESSIENGSKLVITRNGEEFYDLMARGINYGIDKARCLITEIQEHPIGFNEINFEKELIGKKVWYRSQPAIVRSYIKGQACVMLEPDRDEAFLQPPEFDNDIPMYEDGDAKVEIFDKHIWWFRD